MTGMGRVSGLWRYPVKSMQGEQLGSVDITERGIPGDRAWAIRDETDGHIKGAKRIGRLMELGARYESDADFGAISPPARITIPGGETFSTTDADADARLSRYLDQEVSVWPIMPAENEEHYRRYVPESGDLLADLRAIFGREDDEPLPDLSLFPPEIIQFESPPGSYVDAYPVLIVSEQSFARLRELAPGSRIDVRRFRPNIVVDVQGASPGFPEQSWVGSKVSIGDAVLDVVAPCPRCVMITREFADLPRDRELMRTVVREADQNVGVYAKVVTPATVGIDAEVGGLGI